MSYPRSMFDGGVKDVDLLNLATDAAGRTSRYISLKGCAKCCIRVKLTQGAANTVLLSILQATTVAGANSKALANAVPISANQDTATLDAFTKQTAGVAFTTSATTKNKVVWFDIDPAVLDINNGFDCIAISTGASSASNLTEATAYLMGQRFPGTSAIAD